MAVTCKNNEYEGLYTCVQCELSPCESNSCNGGNICPTCPTGITSSASGCDGCTNPGEIPVNKRCVSCTTLGSLGGDGKSCDVPSTGDSTTGYCPKESGVYKDPADGNKCKPCSATIFGCTKCEHDGNYLSCKECPSGTTTIDLPIDGLSLCLEDDFVTPNTDTDFSLGLFPVFAFLIALLTLI